MNTSLKKLLIATCAALPFMATCADAQTTRASCDADARAQKITGPERDVFMSACLPPGVSAESPTKTAKVTKTSTSAKTSKAKKTTKAKKTKTKKTVKAKKPVPTQKVVAQ
jgi:hypothetical protein